MIFIFIVHAQIDFRSLACRPDYLGEKERERTHCSCDFALLAAISREQGARGPRERSMDIYPASTRLKQGYDFSNSVGKIENVKFDFGKRNEEGASVDQTLATLFDTLTVECR